MRATTQYAGQNQLSMWTTFQGRCAGHRKCVVLVAVRGCIGKVHPTPIEKAPKLNNKEVRVAIFADYSKFGFALLLRHKDTGRGMGTSCQTLLHCSTVTVVQLLYNQRTSRSSIPSRPMHISAGSVFDVPCHNSSSCSDSSSRAIVSIRSRRCW